MNAWEKWEERVNIAGTTRRERDFNSTVRYITYKDPHSLSSHEVLINGAKQRITILNREEFDEKRIVALPGETLAHGGLVEFADNHWLITQVDANDEVNMAGLMQQCNYLLKWRDSTGKIIERWSIVEDGTKYLVGEDERQVMTTGGARFAVTLSKDEDTAKLKRGKRFLLYDPDCDDALAFEITKPNTLFNVFEEAGVYRFILVETNMTENDNKELMIADYYHWDPNELINEINENITDTTEKKVGVWL